MPVRARRHESEQIADAIHSAAIRLLRRVRREDERAGIGPGQLSALSVVVFGGPMRLTDLARAEQVKPPTITRIVAALEREGLVERRGDEGDARVFVIEATSRGRRLMEEGRRRRVERLAGGVARFSREQRQVLREAAELLKRLAVEI